MAKNKIKEFNPREFMELAIVEMYKSIQEARQDKVSPKVGALLIKPIEDNGLEVNSPNYKYKVK